MARQAAKAVADEIGVADGLQDRVDQEVADSHQPGGLAGHFGPRRSRRRSRSRRCPATFSVPERRPPSWPPPATSGVNLTPLRTYNAPTPFGPCSLWAESDSRSIGCDRTSNGILPAACTASVWNKTPWRGAIAGQFRHRLERAEHVVGRHDRNQPRVGPNGLLQIGRIDDAVAVDRQQGRLDAEPRKSAATFQHGRMFDRTGDDVARAISRSQHDAPESPWRRPRCRCR